MGVNVIKKNGTVEKWDFSKIIVAIEKSARRVDYNITNDDIKSVRRKINRRIKGKTDMTVAEIHAIVEASLKEVAPRVGKSYGDYRNYKKTYAESFDELFQQTKETLYQGDRENANFDSALISTKGSLIRGYLTKDLYKRFYLSKTELQAMKDGYIYAHDMRDLIFGSFNCCLFDAETVMKGGFQMSGMRYNEPNTALTASHVIGDITLCVSAQQFGGFTIAEVDKILVPYALKSKALLEKKALKYGIRDIEAYVNDGLRAEIRQGIQSIEMKLNSVPSSRGDTAFVTISFGNVDGSVDTNIQRMICECILETRMKGQGNGSPVVFPKLVYLHSEKQHEDPKQDDLFRKALVCSSSCMYPDYLSLDHSEVGEIFNRTGKVVSPMGCRAYLSDYVDENGESYFVGRANIGAVSLNLPMIWKRTDGKKFYEDLSKFLEMIRQFHIKRYSIIADTQCSTNPLCFTQGGIRGGLKKPTEKIGMDIVKQFTASFGITSLNELNVLMEGKMLHESDRVKIKEVVKFISDRVAQFKKEDGFLYALYGTPAESLAGTQLNQFKKMFGEIPGVSDREYFTNSFHAHVSANITPFEKQDIEHDLFHMITGGHIQYVRLDNPKNIDALYQIVKRGMKMGFYQGVNFDLVVCEDCGWRPNKSVTACPECGSENITETTRICGYLSNKVTNGHIRINFSKLEEIKDRVSM